jgi:hypothetical protein
VLKAGRSATKRYSLKPPNVSFKPMTQQNPSDLFNGLCEKYSIWAIKYCSITFSDPVYFIWYTDTDEDSTDKLLTYKTGDIFTSKSLTDFKDRILKEKNNLTATDNLEPWLNDFYNMELVEYCTYDMIAIKKSLSADNLETSIIKDISDFINLFGDFANQDIRNNYLKQYIEKPAVKAIWDYFYESIFWPNFNKEISATLTLPPLTIDTKLLAADIDQMIEAFEKNINL